MVSPNAVPSPSRVRMRSTFERAEAICRELGESEALYPILFGHYVFHMVRAEAEAMLRQRVARSRRSVSARREKPENENLLLD